MKRTKLLMALVAITLAMLLLAGCSRNGNGNAVDHIGPNQTAKNTVIGVLSNTEYPTGISVNWNKSVSRNADVTMTGLQTIAFILDGDEKMDGWTERSLSSIKLEFTGQTSGKKVSLDTSLTGKVSNLGADSKYFKVDGTTFYFYPHYFSVGEDVTVKATFTYKAEGLVNQLLDSKTAEGFITFTVGEDTGETFEGLFDGIGNIFGSGDNSNSDSSTEDTENPENSTESTEAETAVEYIPVNFKVSGIEETFVVQRYENESLKNVISLPSSTITLTFFTRENNRNITKMYIVPKGYEEELQKLAWSNEWFADNCHKYESLDLSQFSGQTITLRVEFLEGDEWNPLKDHFYGFITIQIP